MKPKRHPKINVFLARFLEASGNIGGSVGGASRERRRSHFLQRIPQGGAILSKNVVQFAEPTAQGVLDPEASPVFVYYSKIFFDNLGRPGGSAGESVTPDAPSTLRRRSVDAPSMFPEASKKRSKKTLIFGCLFGSHSVNVCIFVRIRF